VALVVDGVNRLLLVGRLSTLTENLGSTGADITRKKRPEIVEQQNKKGGRKERKKQAREDYFDSQPERTYFSECRHPRESNDLKHHEDISNAKRAARPRPIKRLGLDILKKFKKVQSQMDRGKTYGLLQERLGVARGRLTSKVTQENGRGTQNNKAGVQNHKQKKKQQQKKKKPQKQHKQTKKTLAVERAVARGR